MALPADFEKIFGSTFTGGIVPISDVNYSKGWEYVGGNPPTKNDFSYLQNFSDLKSQWLYANKLQRSNPFGDIFSDGTTSTARTNLGLGTAATRNVGSATGTSQIPDMNSFSSGTQYFKLPTGNIVQAFLATINGTDVNGTTINFPIPFPNSMYAASAIWADGSATAPVSYKIMSHTQTSVRIKVSASTGAFGTQIIAIGI